jgi:hypothetical protein
MISFLFVSMTDIRTVPADFEDKLTVFLRNEFVDDTNANECEETVLFLVQRISSMFVSLSHHDTKKEASQVSAYTMFLRSKDSGNWKTMSEEEKLEYRIMADEENVRRGSKILNNKRISAHSILSQEHPNTHWDSLSMSEKEHYKKLSQEQNNNLPCKKTALKLESKSYGLALRYLRKHMPHSNFATWSKLGEEGHNAWCAFVKKKLCEDMNRDLYKDLVYDAAQRYCELFMVS